MEVGRIDILAINIGTFLLLAFGFFALFLKVKRDVVLGQGEYYRENKNSSSKKKETPVIYSKLLFPRKKYIETIEEMVMVYKMPQWYAEKEYEKAVKFSLASSIMFSLMLTIASSAPVAIIFLVVFYMCCNFLYMQILRAELKKYKDILSEEAIGILLQFGIRFEFDRNIISVLRDKIIPNNYKRDISRQLEEFIKMVTNEKLTIKEAVYKCRLTMKDVLGMEIFLTHIRNASEQGINNKTELAGFAQNVIVQKKMEKERRIKAITGFMEAILILFFVIPVVALLMMPSLIQKNGDLNLLDLLKTVITGG